ncbi:cardiolipin synthase [Persicirhabdus sediminis]|uniref:Cardiolipin synthase n=1 Tax=Persicirhabdus sediminis TaxID=454144 RepID=A0A8J7SFR0_9BACT|nr:cardiolipin synthase [Persicirhabdus sediminis]MBK1789630.1 cardiolipin synthase [Persicirhabdus sediminis]
MRQHRKKVATILVLIAHLAGALTSVRAVMETRTAQGAIAWVISLNTFPYGAVPAYWVFGRSRFEGYSIARRQDLIDTMPVASNLMAELKSKNLAVDGLSNQAVLLERLAKLPFTGYNEVDLLIDGEQTFDAIFESIDRAEDYILVQFYIVRNDELGKKLKAKLEEKARAGVRVYMLYDEIGSHQLPRSYRRELRDAGVEIYPFHSTKGSANRFQLNFRNHRKIVVVDGHEAFVGGHNVGDEYLGVAAGMPEWRDTHVRLRGPVVQSVQIPFAEDLHWASGKTLIDINWSPKPAKSGNNAAALCLATGPADTLESCTLFFLNVINSAQDRLWIASPYFVPDEQVVSALQLAALRGVDVRILIPEKADSQLVWLSSFSYLNQTEKVGVKVYRYQPGFLHQKVTLVDDQFASVGTANFDNRSFRLNFEITIAVKDKDFASRVEAMLLDDFSESELATVDDYNSRSYLFKFLVKSSRLMAPVQ